MIQCLKEFSGFTVNASADDPQSALPSSRQHHILIEDLCDALRVTEPLQSSDGENDAIELAGAELPQPGIHIAAQRHKLQRREAMPQLNLTPQAARTDRGPVFQLLDLRPVRDECVPWVLPFRNGAELD